MRTYNLMLCLVMVALAPTNATAQSSARGRDPLTCAQADSVLRTGSDAQSRRVALGVLRSASCPGQVVGALGHVWTQGSPSDVEAVRLATATIADRRLLDILVRVAGDDARPRAVRMAALSAMVTYADPPASVSTRLPEDPATIVIGDLMDFSQEHGPAPLSGADRAAIPGRLTQVSAMAGDRYVAVAAGRLAQQLRTRLERRREK